MCNDYERQIDWEQYCKAVAAAELGMKTAAGPGQLPPAEDVRINNEAPVMVATGNAVDLVPMRWSFLPARAGRSPVFNFRSEGRTFANSKRCLVPASAFFEFTGAKSPKNKWRFALKGSPVLAMAGLWREEDDRERRFTILTTSPGRDVKPFHDRQVVILPPQDWAHWLYLDRPEAEILKPLPEGSLQVTLAREGADPPPERLRDLAK